MHEKTPFQKIEKSPITDKQGGASFADAYTSYGEFVINFLKRKGLSTEEVIHIELCNKCHPFYTGEQRFVDTASRIDKFTKKQEKAKIYQATVTKKKEEIKKKEEGPKSLREMLLTLK